MAYSGDWGNMAAHFDSLKLEKEPTPCDALSPEDMKYTGDDLDLGRLLEELDLLKEAMRMVNDTEHSTSFYILQLNEQIEARRRNIQELESQWNVLRKPLERKRWNLIESSCAKTPDGQFKLQKLKEIEMEMHSVLSETIKREEESVKLADDLAKQPKIASRRDYIQRITEITNNSRKLDADIERILKDTRELKLETNSIEERFHRAYTVVEETVTRETKKETTGRQAYQLLTSIHETFEEICQKILATDKTQREVAELEAKLSRITSQNMDMNKVQADFDAIRMENEKLEKTLQDHQCGRSS